MRVEEAVLYLAPLIMRGESCCAFTLRLNTHQSRDAARLKAHQKLVS